jgi:hypothetical protein
MSQRKRQSGMTIHSGMLMVGNGLRIGYWVLSRSGDLRSELLLSINLASVLYNYILFPRYPKQQRLLTLKKAAVTAHATPPFYLSISSLDSLHGTKFDSILIDPPFSSSFTWVNLAALPVPSLAADPSFVFLWVGSGAGDALERGREVLAKWGYRRCEDVVWIKTNTDTNRGPGVSFFLKTFVGVNTHCVGY